MMTQNGIEFNVTDKRKEGRQHRSGHPMAHYKLPNELFGVKYDDSDVTLKNLQQKYADEINEDITCDVCLQERFKGLRFKCDTCPNYDICQQCMDSEKTSKNHKLDHPVIVITNNYLPQIDRNDIEFKEEDFLGGGAFGKVYKAKWLSKKLTVACKVIHAKAEQVRRLALDFLKELAAFKELSGAFILKIYGYAIQKLQNDDLIFMLITEYMDKGSLSSVIYKEDISLRRKIEMAANIASGMRKIHQHGMIHRDIKPDNILVSSNYTAKIGDMGIARMMHPDVALTHIGPQLFMPPEFYRNDYDQKLDIYTFGLTLNELFTETKHKFNMGNGEKTLTKQSPILSELIARCIDSDPSQRPTAYELEKSLEVYDRGFNELVLKRHLSYITWSNEKKNKAFMQFYEQFHSYAKNELEKIFPLPQKTKATATPTAAQRTQTTVQHNNLFCKTH
ncbi:unnamed protein product [Didymodactylos carnosus]|uniref:Uncharacterized protein n=1 Tax=Didymodactylos carnosus TaxID=1234261 RepID=A0A815JUC1_9BILA|nr:unnamed protein product [Didymodactylos carnosus]CAF1448308.1 unnamed protein product [Didymodactylos carnosus]CAF4243463.1 unnamed protein product [Didymodactylos carnosus]CAF4278696.1 unnamed protein product [Didymodactylos carnosus]